MVDAEAKARKDRLVGGVAGVVLAAIVIAGLVAVFMTDPAEEAAEPPAPDPLVPVREWLAGYCAPFEGVGAVFADWSNLFENPPTDAAVVQQTYVDMYGRTTEALTAMADRFEAIGEPPVEDVEPDFIAVSVAMIRDAVVYTTDLRDRAAAVDPADPAAVDAFSQEIAAIPNPLPGVFDKLDDLSSAAVNEAIGDVPECAPLVNPPAGDEPAPAESVDPVEPEAPGEPGSPEEPAEPGGP